MTKEEDLIWLKEHETELKSEPYKIFKMPDGCLVHWNPIQQKYKYAYDISQHCIDGVLDYVEH